MWDKDIGEGYNYKVTVDEAGTITQTIPGTQGFGNAGLIQVKTLTKEKQYTVTVQLACEPDY